MTLGASSFIENRFQDAVTLDEGFYRLPQRLQDKILPPFVLTEQEKVRQRLLLSNAQVHSLEEMQAQHGQAIKAKADSTANPAQGVGEAAQTADAPAAALCGLAPTPLTNRGVKSQDGYSGLPSFEALEKLKLVAMGKGKYQAVSIPLPDKSKDVKHSFVDWVNFTFKADLFPIELNTGHPALGDEDYITALSLHLHDIFGYGITRKRESGLNFYHHSYDLGFNGWGIVCIGGQNGTVLVTVKGQGLMSAKVGWELRLKRFLQNIPDAKITRVDLAHDSFNSEVSLNDYLEMYRAGLFNGRGCPPEVECHGNWEKPNGKGRTLYIGSRQSGRYLRIYEKGLQLAKGYHDVATLNRTHNLKYPEKSVILL
ncbi:replication initiation factor domain-containing protein [Methylovulum psychrotolerans]|uniref:Replication initiation protein-like C-terminal domain-containing protein n=1 Tax=Methylovulum psychrotolerans TaxID=1704499 RepID=A0A1Z4BX74_9GAMM|nr:replication initiation factor domain-containing protein [Methylovulum psychrotolerans]ASF45850.1 hypothetical protein CEK71_07040 [Methylovulum psychrotolerans]